MTTACSAACARAAALSAAVTRVEQELAHYEAQWLTRLERGLDALIDQRVVYLDTVIFAPLDAVYDALLDATLQAITEASSGQDTRSWAILRPVLLGAVAQVTLKGLGAMLQTAPDARAIVTALETGQFAYTSPLWGGKRVYGAPRYRFIVLPPVAAADLAELQHTAEERHFGPALVTAQHVTAGCCLVDLAFFPVTAHADVLPPLYTNGTAGPAQQAHETFTHVPASAWAESESLNHSAGVAVTPGGEV